jgi:hypothetical protein
MSDIRKTNIILAVKHQHMKTYGRTETKLYVFLTLAPYSSEWLDSRCFNSVENVTLPAGKEDG